jgi:hypothetical protein
VYLEMRTMAPTRAQKPPNVAAAAHSITIILQYEIEQIARRLQHPGIANGVKRFGVRLGIILLYRTVAVEYYRLLARILMPHHSSRHYNGVAYQYIMYTIWAGVRKINSTVRRAAAYSAGATQYESNSSVLNSGGRKRSSRSVIPLDTFNRSARGCSVLARIMTKIIII